MMNRMIGRAFLGVGLSVFMACSVMAQTPPRSGEPLKDPILESEARTLFKELRCVVCQGQSIDESQAELALDMQSLIRERLSQGENPSQIKEYLHSRYGDFILLSPPLQGIGLWVWILPPVFLIGLGLIVMKIFKKSAKHTSTHD